MQLIEKFSYYLLKPILDCFESNDDKVKILAMDHLNQYNEHSREIIFIHFNEVFETVLNHIQDEEYVRKALSTLDNQLKNAVNDFVPENNYFNLSKFMNLLERKMKTKNNYHRGIICSWIKCLDSIQNLDIFRYLPLILEGLFLMLGDTNKEIRSGADKLLQDFFSELQNRAEQDQQTNELIIEKLIEICKLKGSNYNYAKLNAVLWIFEYLRIFQLQLEEQYKNIHLQDQEKQDSLNEIKQDSQLRKTILSKISYILDPILTLLSHEEEEIKRAAHKTNDLLLKIMDKIQNSTMEFMNFIPIIKDMLTQKKSATAEHALIWIKHLIQIYSDKIVPTIDDILQILIEKLNDQDSSVVQNVMDVLGNYSQHDKILNVFYTNKEIQQKKSELIIKKLCSCLDPVKVYYTISAKFTQNINQYDVEFINSIVNTLNYILVSDKELVGLRQLFRNLQYDESKKEENLQIFETIYNTFSYNPMSTITLCFLTEEYELAYNIIISFAETEIDQETLVQIAQLINMLESSIFVCNIYLRLQLLDYEQYPYLMKSLYGLMMLLPQGFAFNKLKQRLKNTKNQTAILGVDQQLSKRKPVLEMDKKKLLNIFRQRRQASMENKKDLEIQYQY